MHMACADGEKPRAESGVSCGASECGDQHGAGRELQVALVGREKELQRLVTAMQNRTSLLIWGAADGGKTALIQTAIESQKEDLSLKCLYEIAAETPRQLAADLVRDLYVSGDTVLQDRIRARMDEDESIDRWLGRQSSGRLKLLFYAAARRGRYWIFLDHFPPATASMARFIREIIWRCETPVYWLALGCTRGEIGHIWSTYFAPEYQLHVGALRERQARDLLERCIRCLDLAALNLADFRAEVLLLSRGLPGSIVKMCEMAADPRYRRGRQIKVRQIYVEYLLEAVLLRAPSPLPSHFR